MFDLQFELFHSVLNNRNELVQCAVLMKFVSEMFFDIEYKIDENVHEYVKEDRIFDWFDKYNRTIRMITISPTNWPNGSIYVCVNKNFVWNVVNIPDDRI